MSRPDIFGRVCKKPVLLGFIVLVGMVCLLSGIKYLATRHYQDTIISLEQKLAAVRIKLESESVRQYEINKVIRIMDKYPVDMPSEWKFEIADEIYSMTTKYPNLNTALITALITYQTDGTWNPEYKDKQGGLGLLAIMPVTGMFIASHQDITWTSAVEILTDARYNIRIGSHLLSTLITGYDVDGGLLAFAYNERIASQWLSMDKKNSILSAEMRGYLNRMQQLYNDHK